MAGMRAAAKITRWIEPWGDRRFPIDVELLARQAHTMYGRDDPITQFHGEAWDGFDGFLQRSPDHPEEWWLSYNNAAPPGRVRFSQAHELGHYVLHSQRQDRFRCGPDAIVEKDTGEPNIEAQANQFASYLLMPANDVRPRIEAADITLDLIGMLAERYGVSFEAMCIRVVELTAERAVLVYWDNGMMRRWSRSDAAKRQRLWLEQPARAPLEPPAGTLAADAGVRQCREGRSVAARHWFRTAPDGEMVREMKHTSDTYERVLSLLIVARFEPRWARDDEEPIEDAYDRFVARQG